MQKKEKSFVQLLWPDRSEEIYSKVHDFQTVEIVGQLRNNIQWLIHGDNVQVLSTLSFGPTHKIIEKAGGIKMIYIDPPFEVGNDFYMRVQIGEKKKTIKELAYRDKWNGRRESYLSMIYTRLKLMHRLLADDGCLLFHCDWRLNSKIRLILDEIFGSENFVNEIIWSYRSGGVSKTESLPRKHDSILLFRKSKKFKIRPLKERQYLQKAFMGSKIDQDGRIYVDTLLRDVLEGEINIVRGNKIEKYNTRPVLNLSKERLDYPTQKPEGLLKLLIELTTDKNDLIADFFCGSGSTLAAAQQLGRQWIGCDRSALAVHTAFKRLHELNNLQMSILQVVESTENALFTFGYEIHRHRNKFSITITAFHNFDHRKGDMERWQDWIDYWAIDFKYIQAKGFKSDWCEFRTKKKRTLRLSSNSINVNISKNYLIGIRLVDVFARSALKVIAL
ncbi:site-specific DNA-methyltransferase [bacterium]|nr:site-specific DNA-methyltransferase [bacterium]